MKLVSAIRNGRNAIGVREFLEGLETWRWRSCWPWRSTVREFLEGLETFPLFLDDVEQFGVREFLEGLETPFLL